MGPSNRFTSPPKRKSQVDTMDARYVNQEVDMKGSLDDREKRGWFQVLEKGSLRMKIGG